MKLPFHAPLRAAGKPMLAIEYPRAAPKRDIVGKLAHNGGFTWLIADRQLKTLGESGR